MMYSALRKVRSTAMNYLNISLLLWAFFREQAYPENLFN